MADENQVALLRQGGQVWNSWRASNSNVQIDLSDANLSNANLHRTNLSRTNLSDADLSGANFSKVHLIHADLESANLRDASLDLVVLDGSNGFAFNGSAPITTSPVPPFRPQDP